MITMMKGTIARLEYEKGFGFITPEGADGADHFFNIRTMHVKSRGFHTLKVGDRVTFIATQSEKGPRAVEVLAD